MNFRLIFLCAAFLIASPLVARGKSDVIVMRNGDRITCEIKALDGETLYIKVSYILNTLSVDWSRVDHVESKQLFIVKTQDGSLYTGIISIPETPGRRPVKLEVSVTPEAKIDLVKTEVVSVEQTSLNFWERFNGQIGFGSTYSKGNQARQYSLSSQVAYPTERWQVGASYSSNLTASNGSSTSNRNEIGVTGQRLMRWDNWYYSGQADCLQSSVQQIRLQNTLGGGVGRYIRDTNHIAFTVTAGLAWQQINYSGGLVPVNSENVMAAFVSSNLSLFYFDKTTLTVKATVLPSLSDPGRFHTSLDATYYVKLWKDLKWNLTFYGNWDNRPPLEFSGSDYGSTTGLTWTFGNR